MGLKGVNLGGWLVLEKWMTLSLFDGLKAKDETSFCIELGDRKKEVLQKHWQTFIIEADFKWIASRGLNAVRIPIGYWVFGDIEPYVGSLDTLDWAMEMAEKYNLKVIIDLHGASGSQNGADHSGKVGAIEWTEKSNIELTLDTIGRIAQRYGDKKVLRGIEVLNEPGWDVPLDLLREFYEQAYERVREYCSKDIAVIISDTFRPREWSGFMSEPNYQNVILDSHYYQCFSAADKVLNLQGHLDKTRGEWADDILRSDKPVIIGEWSLALDARTFAGMDERQKDEAIKAYADAQLQVFNQAAGWFFWSYKLEKLNDWNFRHCVETGILPRQF